MAPGLDPSRHRSEDEPQKKGRRSCAGHCPSWARTRTLLIQRGQYNQPNPSNLLTFTRVRATQCCGLLAAMLDFALVCSHKCQSLPSRLRGYRPRMSSYDLAQTL